MNIRMRRLITIPLPMLVVGSIALLFSYIYTSQILTFIGLGLLFWGSVLYYSVSSYHVPRKLLDAYARSYAESTRDLRSKIGTGTINKAVFFYPSSLKSIMQGYVIFHDGIDIRSLLTVYSKGVEDGMDSVVDSGKGYIVLKAYSQGIVDLIEDRVEKSLALVDINELQSELYKVMVEDLLIADDIILDVEGDSVRVKMVGKDNAALCSSIEDQSLCPLCSGIALAVSKCTGKAVTIEDSKVKSKSVENTLRLIDMR